MPNSSFKVNDLTAANSIVISTVTLSVSGGNLVLPPGTTVANVAIGSGTGIGATGATGPAGNIGPIGATGPAGATGAGSFSYGNTAPVSPTIGSRWLDSESGKEFIWVVAGATGVWIQSVGGNGPQGNIGNIGATGATGITGATGPAGPTGSSSTSEPTVTSIVYPTGYTSLDIYGGETVTLIGTNFFSNSQVIIDHSRCNVITANSTTINFSSPIKYDGEYHLYVQNFNGATRVVPLGIKYLARGIAANVFMVAGGGAGGSFIGAGGGAGGILVGSLILPTQTTYAVVIGAGGAAGSDGTPGANTTFAGFNTIGGGGAYAYTGTNGANQGIAGGSGGGGAGNRGGTSAGGAALQTSQTNAYGTLTGYGNAGGIGTASGDPIQPAGGGGAGGVGGNGRSSSPTKAGDGGLGIYNAFRTGANIGYGGGGTGQPYNSAENPVNNRDTFGGGVSTGNDIVSGVANTGGGGGGAGFAPYSGPGVQGAGGSGIVVIRYAGNVRGSGGTITNYTSANVYYTVHTFTTSGSLIIT